MDKKHFAAGAVLLLTATLAGCQTVPADYAARLSPQDPKWQSQQCRQMRFEASRYDDTAQNTFPLRTGLLLGPYGVGIAVAGMEHREKQRKQFVRDMHLRCSSLPLPRDLRATSTAVNR